ncbi:MAG: winged helix-turn-helix domain-containing protein [Nevskia sp.]|nr:winged helix-turn-helix domain-containing protein [Nevskia sp.]
MALPSRLLLREELLKFLRTRTGASVDETCAALAGKLGLSDSDLAIRLKCGESLFRSEVRWAKRQLMLDGLVERPASRGNDLWRTVRHRDVAEQADEIPPTSALYYMARTVTTIKVNRYERNRVARRQCIEFHGLRCLVCGFDFEEAYGELGRACIHVHHIVPSTEVHAGYRLDPVKDLRPICPNCHYMIHRADPAYSIDHLRAILRRHSAGRAQPAATA